MWIICAFTLESTRHALGYFNEESLNTIVTLILLVLDLAFYGQWVGCLILDASRRKPLSSKFPFRKHLHTRKLETKQNRLNPNRKIRNSVKVPTTRSLTNKQLRLNSLALSQWRLRKRSKTNLQGIHYQQCATPSIVPCTITPLDDTLKDSSLDNSQATNPLTTNLDPLHFNRRIQIKTSQSENDGEATPLPNSPWRNGEGPLAQMTLLALSHQGNNQSNPEIYFEVVEDRDLPSVTNT
jgi:hypothetical protein